MTRKIKFRVWDKELEEFTEFPESKYGWVSGRACLGLDGSLYCENAGWLEETDEELYEVVFNTGLKDKNGVEIYEGDVVASASPELIFQVVFKAPSYCRKWIDDVSKRYRNPIEPMAWNTHIICEVVGNIYEHPHLIEEV